MVLRNKRILITGVAKGGIAESFMWKVLNQDNRVLICSLTMTNKRYPSLKSFQADCTKESLVQKLESWVINETGGIDVLVNAIGGSLQSIPPLEVSQEFFERVISVNLTSSFLLTQMAVRLMENGGSIVHVVSSSAFEPEVKKMPYAVAKAGQVHLIKSMAIELANKNIRINGVSPTYVYTKRHKKEIAAQAEKNKTTIQEIKKKKMTKQLIQLPLLPNDLNEMIEFAITSQVMTGNILHATLGRILG